MPFFTLFLFYFLIGGFLISAVIIGNFHILLMSLFHVCLCSLLHKFMEVNLLLDLWMVLSDCMTSVCLKCKHFTGVPLPWFIFLHVFDILLSFYVDTIYPIIKIQNSHMFDFWGFIC